MNTEFDRLQELEWQAQERALRAERGSVDALSAGSRDAEYRLVARALRLPMPDMLPADFAQRLAARVGQVPLDTRMERWLVRLLAGAMAASGLAAVLIYGGAWWRAVVGSVPDTSVTTVQWMVVAGACMGGSWLMECLRQQATRQGGAHA